MSTADEDLVRLAQAGHRPAFEMLVRNTSRLVWSHLILQTRDRTLAEDLAQETYLRAWRSLATLDAPGNFRAWLIRISDRVRLDELKQSTRKKRGPSATTASTQGGDAESPGPSPSENAEKSELCNRAIDAMRQLPDQYQQALALRYLGGADYDEISRQLALSNGSLRGLLHRGLEMLRDKLKDENGVNDDR